MLAINNNNNCKGKQGRTRFMQKLAYNWKKLKT